MVIINIYLLSPILSKILSANQKHKDETRKVAIELIWGIILFLYGIIPTLQPSHFGRTNAVYEEYSLFRHNKGKI